MVIRRVGFAILVTALCGLSPAWAAEDATCARAGTLGVSRTVEIDTTGGPGFGMEHYKAYDFLQDKEVVLTFDDGPQKYTTEAVLKALADECVKATFFSIGKMALGYPEIIREVAKAGHTIGTHTWDHKAIAKLKTFDDGKDEIERGISAVHRAVGGPIAPFFRYPTLVDTQESLTYLGKRDIAVFSTDIDSFDFKPQTADHLVTSLMQKLDKRGKGIILMHDIHKTTAKAVPAILAQLKAKGYKIVHMTAKFPVTTVAEYDQAIEKEAKGLPQIGAERPVSSIVKTVGGSPPASEAQSSTGTGSEPEGLPSSPASEPAAATPAPAGSAQLPAFPTTPSASSPPPSAPAATSASGPGKQSSAEPVTPPPQAVAAAVVEETKQPVVAPPASAPTPVTTAAVPSPVSTVSAAQASVPAAPTKVVTAEASPVKTVSGVAPPVTTTAHAEDAAKDDMLEPAGPAQPKKSISEKIKETWRFWFGE